MASVGQDLSTLLEQEEEPGPRQRRPRPPGGLLPGFAGDARGAGDRLRHPLRVRHLRSGDSRRLAGRAHRQVAALRQSVGDRARPRPPSTCSSAAAPSRTATNEGRHRVRWIPDRMVKGIAYDTPMLGYRVPTTNLLRLWKAEATESFDFEAFNVGDYYGAVEEKVTSETISKVLYPNDEPEIGQEAAARAAVFLRLLLAAGHDPPAPAAAASGSTSSMRYWAAQLNDTHPAIAVAELMRLLVDEHVMDWDQAWQITQRDVRLHEPHAAARGAGEVAAAAVRHAAAASPRDHLRDQPAVPRRRAAALSRRRQLLARLSLIDETGERSVRMAHLAHGRQSRRQRRRRAAHRAAEADRAPRLLRSSGRRSSSTRPTASRRGAGWC